LADEAVTIEPVSASEFPANREINREYRDSGVTPQVWLQFNQQLQRLEVKFPTQKNREFFEANREIYPLIRENYGPLTAISRHVALHFREMRNQNH
jgi:hypothetical protein